MSSPSSQSHHPRKGSGLLYNIGVSLLFAFLSTTCTIYNKFIFERVHKSSNGLLLVQNVFTVCVLYLCVRLRWLDFTFSLSHRGDWIAGLVYSLNVMCGLWSLVFVNIAMFGALKRCTIVVSWAIEYLFDGRSTTVQCLPPLVLMLTGTLIASHADLSFSLIGYLLAGMSCVAQGAALELGRRVAKSHNKGIWSVLYANSVVSIVLQVFVLIATGELFSFLHAIVIPRIAIHFLLNSAMMMLMNYTVFLNCSVNSPLAHTVVGNLKTVVTTGFGVLVFATPITLMGWIGLSGNFSGGAWFSWVKFKGAVASSRGSSSGGGSHHADASSSPSHQRDGEGGSHQQPSGSQAV